MVTGRSMRLDGGIERLRRLVDVIDVVDVIHVSAGEPRGTTATDCHNRVLFCLNLRNGDDDHDRRGG
ncbi:MAG TPA: hypothetical protein VNH39_11850 [Steroidobacteraceae bacterium]|nr:hypothetical protein [Steroidobacteraceae bacterium]